ncbi:MAG: hypothetical protein ABFQ65_03775 [Nanoarchaeota archaeon]
MIVPILGIPIIGVIVHFLRHWMIDSSSLYDFDKDWKKVLTSKRISLVFFLLWITGITGMGYYISNL